ncbi:MAG TPA: GNAT family N-acetyltransferase [Micromonosporaceae bacterium]|nr:GNAT family N-acetyltransferase [Micromonosporaceae bacterium]
MADVTVVPATAGRFDDVASLLAPNGGTKGCWCLYWRLSAGDFTRTRDNDRPDRMRRLVESSPAPGMLAYVDGVPAGWLAIGPRTDMERLVRSRTIPVIDDSPVWSVVCFLVRPGYRRQGLARRLLEGAIEYARSQRAAGLEAYPVDSGGGRIHTSAAYVGTLDLFTDAGFRVVTTTQATSAGLPRLLVRLDFS